MVSPWQHCYLPHCISAAGRVHLERLRLPSLPVRPTALPGINRGRQSRSSSWTGAPTSPCPHTGCDFTARPSWLHWTPNRARSQSSFMDESFQGRVSEEMTATLPTSSPPNFKARTGRCFHNGLPFPPCHMLKGLCQLPRGRRWLTSWTKDLKHQMFPKDLQAGHSAVDSDLRFWRHGDVGANPHRVAASRCC